MLHPSFAASTFGHSRKLRKRRHAVRLHGHRCGNIGNRLARIQVFCRTLAVLRKTRVGLSMFVDRSFVVVARHIRDKRIPASRPPAKRSAAMRHVKREACPVLKHPVNGTKELPVALRRMVRLPPSVKPCGIVFCAHERPLRLILADDSETLLWVGAKVRRLEKLRDKTVLNDTRRIARVERHFEARVDHGLAQSANIADIISMESILVFDLHHQNRPALRDLQRRKLASNGVKPVRRRHNPPRIRRPHRNRFHGIRHLATLNFQL